MSGTVERALRDIATPTIDGLVHVVKLPDYEGAYAGRDSLGNPALLIRSSDAGSTVPLRLAGIEANFSVVCRVAEPGQPERTETLSFIVCLSRERGVETYFASAVEPLLSVLPANPTVTQVREAVQRLVELFQKLRRPIKRELAGLVGEICTILMARDVPATIAGWRVDPEDRFDFVAGRLRIDVKSSTGRRRLHGISFEQANSPAGCFGLLVSVWIDAAGGGTSLAELLSLVEARAAYKYEAVSKLRTIVADTLGETILAAMEWRFDLALAKASILFYDSASIPAIRPPLPAGVSAIRFTSEFEGCSPVDIGRYCLLLDPSEAALLPIN